MFKKFYLALLFVGLAFNFAYSQPKLVIEGGDSYDWGEVWQKDSPLKTKVKIYNKGDETLKILNVKPGCGCTTAPLDKTEIEPGDFTTMDVELKVDNFSGKLTKTIAISTNDPKVYKMYYYLKANVLVPLSLDQRYVFFPEAHVGKKIESKIKITNNHTEPIAFKEFVVSPEEISTNLKKDFVLQPGKSVDVTVTFNPKKVGRMNGAIVIKTNAEVMPRLRINIAGEVLKEKAAKAEKG